MTPAEATGLRRATTSMSDRGSPKCDTPARGDAKRAPDCHDVTSPWCYGSRLVNLSRSTTVGREPRARPPTPPRGKSSRVLSIYRLRTHPRLFRCLGQRPLPVLGPSCPPVSPARVDERDIRGTTWCGRRRFCPVRLHPRSCLPLPDPQSSDHHGRDREDPRRVRLIVPRARRARCSWRRSSTETSQGFSALGPRVAG